MWICEICGHEIWEEEDVYMLRDHIHCPVCYDENLRILRCNKCGAEQPEDMMSIMAGVVWCTACKWAPGGPMDTKMRAVKKIEAKPVINKVVVI